MKARVPQTKLRDESGDSTDLRVWRTPLLYALPLTALVLCLFYYWFAIADRHIVFLYISDSDNFFATSGALQIVVWLIAAAIVLGVTRLRKYLVGGREKQSCN